MSVSEHPHLVSAASAESYADAAAVRAAIEAAVAPFGGFAALGVAGKRVMLKPNFVAAKAADSGAVTHPVFIAETARLVRAAGAAEVLVGDSPAFGSASFVAGRMGLKPLLEEAGGRLVEFRSLHRVRDGLENGRFRVLSQAGEAHEADVLINLAKAKAHRQMVITGAVKNLYGCIPGRRKALWHCMVDNNRVLFGRMLADNARTLGAALHLVDGIVAMEGEGPTAGDPRPWGWVLATRDPVAVDRVLAEAWGYAQDEVPHLVAARAMKWGARSFDDVALHGAEIDAMRIADWKRAQLLPITFNPVRLAVGWLKHKVAWRKAA